MPDSPDDFATVLRRRGIEPFGFAPGGATLRAGHVPAQTEATTILAFKFRDGVIVAGDRRATAGSTVVYDRADKVIRIDSHTLMAIAGVPATAWEMARVLEHSFQFYRRSQLQEMSIEGKVRALSKLLRDNLGLVLQGVGAVSPIFALHDGREGRVYFYDAMGAQFEVTDFASTGSGAPAVRSVLHYVDRWTGTPLREKGRDESLVLALRALETAAISDTATGGVDWRHQVFPTIKIITASGIENVEGQALTEMFHREVG